MFINQFNNNLRQDISRNPLQMFMGMALVLIAMFGGSVKTAGSAVLVLFILYSLFNIKKARLSWSGLAGIEKAILLLFVAYMLSGLVTYVNVIDRHEYVKDMGRYLRFVFILPIVLVMVSDRNDLRSYLLAGISLSGPAYLCFALYSNYLHPELPATGAYHHITFGDAAMMNAMLMMLILVLEPWKAGWKLLVSVSIVCALFASVLSTARGAWIALPPGLIIVLAAAVRHNRLATKYILVVLLISLAGVAASPARDIISSRYSEAVNEIALYRNGENAATSVGQRLAYWDLAMDVWQEHPLLGTGLGDFEEEIGKYQSRGVYPTIEITGSVHNIFFQALASTGLIGFTVLLLAMVLMPGWYFLKCIGEGDRNGYYGLLFVLSYAAFGLSESWIFRSPVVADFIIYFSVFLSTCITRADRAP